MRHLRRRWAPLAAVPLALAAGGVALATKTNIHTGEIGPSLGITANGRVLHPVGRQTVVGNFPTGSALTPDGRFLWVADCGHGSDDVRVVDVASGSVVQVLPLPGCYGGIAISPDGSRAYVDGNPKGGSPTEGPTQGDAGDVIHIFTVDHTTGTGVEQTPLQILETTGGSGRTNSLPPVSGVGTAYPEGLAISPDGTTLVVALNAADSADVVNLATNAQNIVSVGHYPNGVAFDRRGRAYVSNEYDGTVSVIDTSAHSVTTTISGLGGSLGDLASHPEGMATDPTREQLYVAVTNRDLVAVIDTSSESVTRLVSVGRAEGIGVGPVKLAVTPDGGTLFAADSNEDTVAAISLAGRGRRHRGAYGLIGRLPTAAYADDVQVTPDGSQLIWVAGKGYGSGPTEAPYVLDMLIGRVGVLPLPTYSQIKHETRIANKQLMPYDHESQPAGSPIPAAGQGPSQQIKHVFYIVRENRTYDQIFGSDPRGDGEKRYELYDDNGVSGPTGGITPNAHALARDFPLLDHFYMDSEVSVDGHLITTGAYATDYAQKATAANYSGRRGTYDFGIYPVTFPPKFFIFDQASAQGISFKDYGEQAAGMSANGNAPNRTQFAKVEAGLDQSYPNNLFIGCAQAGNPASCTQDSGIYNGTGKAIAGQSRFNEWYPHFQEELAKGTVPTFTYMILPNDHTNGTTSKDFTPQAMVADNDLALGQIVDAISHSSAWPSSAIFVQEDDSQDGFDHVDSHRSPAFVISPWAKHGAVVHPRHDQYSMLRTAELICGIDPLSLNDALATPFYDAFIGGNEKPNDAPYNVITPEYGIGATNAANAPMAHTSNALPWNRLDAVPQAISDRILWAATHGVASAPPPPGPNASPIEHNRAAVASAMLAAHQNVRSYLERGGDH
jgi:YVTN family beta-propeller protein